MQKMIIGGILSILAFTSLGLALSNQSRWLDSGQWTQFDFTIATVFLLVLGAIGFIFVLWGFFEFRR